MLGGREKSYEVHVSGSGRWTTDGVFQSKSLAIRHAKTLIEANKGDAVRVMEDDGKWKPRIVFEETCEGKAPEKLTISPVDDAPLCQAFPDYYAYPARRTMGRVMRKYLDKIGLTALEVLHDPNCMADLARQEAFVNQAIHRVAGIQARMAGEDDPGPRIDELWRVFNQVRDRARETAKPDAGLEALKNQGLNGLMAYVADQEPGEEASLHAGAVLAAHLRTSGDWLGKADLLLELLKDGAETPGRRLADEILAEILDGTEAVRDLLGGQADLSQALLMLAGLATGRAKVRDPDTVQGRLNTVMGQFMLPETRSILLARVAEGIGGIQPLTREDEAADRSAFKALFKTVTAYGGLWGGPAMSDAVTRRLRILFGGDDGDLSVEDAIIQIGTMLPAPVVQLGYLLDLSGSPTGQAHPKVVLTALLKLVSGIGTFGDLLPEGSSPALYERAVQDLQPRLAASMLPDEAGQLVGAKMASFLVEAGIEGGATLSSAQARPPKPAKPTLPRRTVSAGDFVFQEGEPGDEAYIIASGEVEILRKNAMGERTLAILGRGDILGEMALIDDQARMASAKARKDTELAVIPQETFKTKLDQVAETDHVVRRLIDTFVTRLRGVPSED